MFSLKNRRARSFIILAVLLALAVPMFRQPVAQAQASNILHFATENTGDVPTLDPGLVEDTLSAQIVNSTFYPLVRDLEDKPGNIQPGMSDKWTISDDGLTYTFHIRQDISWVKWDGSKVVQVMDANGKPMMVNAHDFEYGIKRMLDPRTASPYAYVFVDSLGIVGAKELNGFAAPEGKKLTDADVASQIEKLRDAVAVKATDDSNLEVKIANKIGYGIYIFGLPNSDAVPQAVIEQFADKWTEPGNQVSYGPFTLSEWKHEASLSIVKNPFWPGIENSPKPSVDGVNWTMIDQTPAFNNYEAGTQDVQFSVPLTELDRVKADSVLSKELTIGPSACTYYYDFNAKKAPFDDLRVRLAFSYAVDRQSLVDNVTKGGQEPARWFARPGIVAAPTMKDSPELGIGYDPDMAKKLLQEYLDEKKITVDQLPPITFMTNQVEAHVKIAEAIQAMWQETLGVNVQLTTQEWKVFLDTRKKDPPQIFRDAWCKDYSDANNFDRDVMRSTSAQNNAKYNSPEFDKLVDQAALETDVAKRTELYRQAETLLVKTDAAIIPLYWYTTVSTTKPYVKRTFASSAGDDRLEKWSLNK